MSLVVYKSSAGSGKTHTLVMEYLKITIQNPDKFRHVLAITFTNKAAGEMKERIISELKELSAGNTKSSMAGSIIESLRFTEEQLTKNATILLANIIHHFEDFGISTIDSFVHRIIRTFATDVKLPHGFEVIIDNEDIIPDIIEDLYNKLGNDKELTSIMVAFVLSLADDEKSYNPEKSLIEFIQQQTREDGFEEIKKLSELNLNRFLEILKLIDAKQNKLKAEINHAAQNAFMLVESNGLEASAFYRGNTGIISYFKKNLHKTDEKSILPTSYVLKTIEEDKWYGSKAKQSDKATIDAIKDELITYYQAIKTNGQQYILLKTVHSKLYAVALVKEIRTLFDDFTLRTNKVHISDFNKKISDSIAGQPAPFIYERLGNKYEHFLIDEFQDTSILQWYNLLPLIENSIANGNFNMLVGDAKQAIYRFRSGEVELFSSLPKLYGKPDLTDKDLREQLLEQEMVEKPLINNFRSYKEIVDFNNNFFTKIVEGNDILIEEIYRDHEQIVSDGKNRDGYVSIDLIESENTDDYKEKRLEKILQQVNNLQQKGFAFGDICVLTLRREDGSNVATHLLSNNIPVISSESLLLSGSAEIRVLIAIFKGLLQPENPVVLTQLIENVLIIKNQQENLNELSTRLLSNSHTAFERILNWAGIETNIELLKQKPVYLLAETLFNSLTDNKGTNIYFQYFLDFIVETEAIFENRLDTFLELWEQKKEKLYVLLPEGENAVQIMTIHKAKGLKFQVVILDFQGRNNKNTKEEFWTNIDIPEAPDLSTTLLPIHEKKLTAIGLPEVYNHEKVKTRLDFLNLIYVAFTRSVEALFILAEKNSSKEKFSKEITKYLKSSGLYEEERSHYEFGELQKLDKSSVSKHQHIPLTKWVSNGGDFPVQVAPPEEVYWEMAGGNSQRIKGKLIHEVLSRIKTEKEISKALNLFLTNGVIDEHEKQQLQIKIESVVNHPKLKPYFSDSALVKNETEIVLPDGEIARPDRVVINDNSVTIIDYKTGAKEGKHINQIRKYKTAFQKLGFRDVRSILVYLGKKIEFIH
jgi:ATP-dependent exoDNAse (exonuclease V) beta subunit